MINTLNWAWPQYVYLILVLIGWLGSASSHGQTKPVTYNVFVKVIFSILLLLLLAAGGFFK